MAKRDDQDDVADQIELLLKSSEDSRSELSTYLRMYHAYPVLDNPDEFAYWFDRYKNGETEHVRNAARDRIVYGNVRLVIYYAFMLRGKGLPVLDNMQFGVMGLVRALEKFDPALGTKYSSYAMWWIRSSIQRGLEETGMQFPFRVTSQVVRQLKYVRRALGQHVELTRSWPHVDRICEILRTYTGSVPQKLAERPAKVAKLCEMLALAPLSLDASMYGDEESETFANVVGAEQPPADAQFATALALERLRNALHGLSKRELDIIRQRFNLDGRGVRTLEEIGTNMGRTRERVRQIEAAALKKLRAVLGTECRELISITCTS